MRNRSAVWGLVVAAWALVAVTGMSLGFSYWLMEGHGAPLTALERVRPGMNRADVTRALGRPNCVSRYDWGEQWVFSPGTFCAVTVSLSPEGTVVETDHDH